MNMKRCATLVAACLLAACSASLQRKSDPALAARVQAAALAPVNHINLINDGFYAWNPINDHQLLAWMSPTRAYLLDLGACPGLEQTPSIAITTRMNQISIHFDTVTTSLVGIPCQIRRIRPLDMQRLRAPTPTSGMDVQVRPRPAQGTGGQA